MQFQKNFGLNHAIAYIQDALAHESTSGDGQYTQLCRKWITENLNCSEVLMTTSCTHALEMALHALHLATGEEVIIPSFTYPSTANAVLLAGGSIVYSEVEKEHYTLDPQLLEEKITKNTKAVVVVHYGGHPCAMDAVMQLASKYNLTVIEDAAQGFLAKYKGKHLGTIGHFGCFSFHGTKDIIAGEGGALIVNEGSFLPSCLAFAQNGTNRADFQAGRVPRYEWTSIGSSYMPSDILMALLWSQLQQSAAILDKRQRVFSRYFDSFSYVIHPHLENFSQIADWAESNYHTFFLVFKEAPCAAACIAALEQVGIPLRTHFIPLHESQMGRQFVRSCNHFDVESGLEQRLVRLPIYPDLAQEEQDQLIASILQFMHAYRS